HQAVVDWPGTYFWRELVNANPQAKVILTVRDADAWYDSVAGTIHRLPRMLNSSVALKGLLAVAGAIDARPRDGLRVMDETIWQGTFGGRFSDRQHAIDVYTAHNAAVERTIAPDRLLVFDVREGWEPLCRFLGVPVPDGPFPHINDSAEFERKVKQRLIPAAAAVAGGALLALTALAALASSAGKNRSSERNVRR
ncbi:MAG: sulfotransferase family protein, partial [Thermomicrobiales bacterium]